ncbi:MAG: hypothetical protein ACLQM8_27740 [Limisphaerales bacterium]
MDKTEFERFSDWVTTSLPKHQVHSAFQNALRCLLLSEFPNTTAIPEVYAVAGGRNDMVQYTQHGKRAVFELFCSLSQIPQDLRLLERADAHWKVAVLLDEQINPEIAANFFRKKPEGLPFLWLSEVIMPSKATNCRAKLRQLLSIPPLHATGPASPKDPGVVQVAHAKDSIVAQTAEGDIHINQKKVVRPQITREPGDITEETAHKIQELIRELAKTEELAGKEPSYAKWQQRLKNRFKAESYRKLTVAQGEAAIKWLKQELGRKTPSLRRANNPEWRNRMYNGIWPAARELGWNHDQVHAFANAELDLKRSIASLTELPEQRLKLLHDKLRDRARRGR